MKAVLLSLVVVGSIFVTGCGEKEEVNPQVVDNPSPELIEKARAASADASPSGDAPPSSSIN